MKIIAFNRPGILDQLIDIPVIRLLPVITPFVLFDQKDHQAAGQADTQPQDIQEISSFTPGEISPGSDKVLMQVHGMSFSETDGTKGMPFVAPVEN
jgi:hypothetical protein